MNDDQKRFDQIVAAYHTPIVFSPGGWGDDLQELWNAKVVRQRLEMIDSPDGWNKATDAEVALYLSSASLEAPLSRDWADIFTYQTSLLMGNQVYEMLGTENQGLSEYQKQEVEHLKHQIRENQIKSTPKSGVWCAECRKTIPFGQTANHKHDLSPREPNKNKGGTMNKAKIIIEEREDGVLFGYSKEGVDPFVKKMELTFEQLVDQMPFVKAVVGIAEEMWKVAPKNPAYAAPPKAEPVKKVEPIKAEAKGKKKGAKGLRATVQPTQAAVEQAEVKQPVVAGETKPLESETKSAIAEIKPPVAEMVAEQMPEKPTLDGSITVPTPAASTTKARVSADAFQYRLKDGRGPFVTIQAALDAMGADPKTRPMHNRYDRLSKKLQEEIKQEKK